MSISIENVQFSLMIIQVERAYFIDVINVARILLKYLLEYVLLTSNEHNRVRDIVNNDKRNEMYIMACFFLSLSLSHCIRKGVNNQCYQDSLLFTIVSFIRKRFERFSRIHQEMQWPID
jgi:hypothetical protein